ncbi:MAG: LPS export ABC transporter periplasmic protein LptC [Pseudomonadales bacterium]|nr:LPS export ABC transporter periplasmic protein LptC [Pseudomonadales bacterium]
MRRYSPVVVILSIAALSLIIYMASQITSESIERQWLDEVKSGSQYVMSNTTTIQYDELGIERFRMRSEQISQVQDSKIVDLLRPELILQKKQRQTWQIKADSGQLLPETDESDEQQLLLQKNVVIDRYSQSNSQDAPVATINTSDLMVYTDSKLAHSSKAVSIRSQTSLTHATGLDLDFNQGVVKLNSQVTTVTQPTPKTDITTSP